MQINCVIELSMVLDSDKFHKLFARALDRNGYMEENGEEYIDR